MTIKEALEIERKRLLEEAETIAAMPPVDPVKWGLKPVWAKPDGDGWDVTEHVSLTELRKHASDTGIEITRSTPDSTYEVLKLKAQLETARKALERIALGQTMSASIAAKALAQIGAGQKGGK